MGKNKKSHKTSSPQTKRTYHLDEIKKESFQANTDEYKEKNFNFSVNTKYLCKRQGCSKKCPQCFSLYESQDLMKIFEKLDEYRGWQWREIERENRTSSGVMNVRDVTDKEIQDMICNHFSKLQLDEEIYKIEINNKRRIWGIRLGEIFYLIWDDLDHYFYKHKNKNYTKQKSNRSNSR